MKCEDQEPRALLVEHKAQLDKYKVRYSILCVCVCVCVCACCQNSATCPGLEAEWLMGFQSDIYQ